MNTDLTQAVVGTAAVPQGDAAEFDPADFSARALILSGQMNPHGNVVVWWFAGDPLPLSDELITVLQTAFAGGGGAYLMARDDATLSRAAAAVQLVVDVPVARA